MDFNEASEQGTGIIRVEVYIYHTCSSSSSSEVVWGCWRVDFFLWSEMEGMWESKVKFPTPILSVRSAILVFRGGVLLWSQGVLGLDGSSPRVSHI